MKKLFIFATLLATISAFAVTPTKYNTPEKIKEGKTSRQEWANKLQAEGTTGAKQGVAHLNTEIKLIEANVNSFADMCKIADEAYAAQGFSCNGDYSTLMSSVSCWGYPDSFIADCYKNVKSKNNYWSMAYMLSLNDSEKCGLTAKEAVTDYETIFNKWGTTNKASAKDVDKLLSGYLAATRDAGTDDAQVKAFLKKLNRIYTEKLLTDKATWEPVVAKIRSLIETY